MPYITVGQENSANIDIYYEDLGTGQTVVLIHGFPLNIPGRSRSGSAKRRVSGDYLRSPRIWQLSQPSSGYDYDTFAADLNTLMTKLVANRVGWLLNGDR